MATATQFTAGIPVSETGMANLTRKERDLLSFLQQNAGKCVPREVLLREVWGYREGVKSRTLDVHVQRLRKKLGPEEGSRILTVFRGGYLWTNGAVEAGAAPVLDRSDANERAEGHGSGPVVIPMRR